MFGELNPTGGGDPIPLRKKRLTVGRRPNCDICLAFPNVSSQHCVLEIENGYWQVTDLGSRNGIKVNDVRCESKFLLPGDVLSVAKHRYEIDYEPLTTEPPPEEADPFSTSLLAKAGLERPPRHEAKTPSSSDMIIGDAQKITAARKRQQSTNLDDLFDEDFNDE